jgi:hypothetical protein
MAMLRIGTSITTLLLGVAATAAAAADQPSPPPAPEPTAGQKALSGSWLIEHPTTSVRTVDGAEPPLQPKAAVLYRQHQASRKKGKTAFDSTSWCAAMGVPRMMFVNYSFEIIVRPKQVAILGDWNWWARIVYMPNSIEATKAPPPPGIPDGPPGSAPPGGPPGGPPGAGGALGTAAGALALDPDPSAMGFSQGTWNGDRLTIQTDHLIGTTLLDNAGMPHSEDLKLTEHLRLVSPNVLEDRIRFEDPATFTKSWETVVTYRRQPSAPRNEDVCLDRIRDGGPAVKE